jgi:beta-galactosidase
MRTTTKRLIHSRDVDAAALGRDGLRYHAWDPTAVRVRYVDLDPTASYELEAVFACERSEQRIMGLVAAGGDLAPPVTLVPGGATTIRVPVPRSAIQAGVLELALERRLGPDAVVSEVRLYSSAPVAPTLTVVGDSRGGLIGTVSDAEYAGIESAAVSVTWPGGEMRTVCGEHGVFRVPLFDALPQGQQAELTISATVDGLTAISTIDTRTLARGLRELPPTGSRIDLKGDWQFAPGRWPDPKAPAWQTAASTRVPGHVAFDGLVPANGIGTLRRTIAVPADWAGDAIFARFDGAYGRAEVFVGGISMGTHSAGATSFDIDLTPYVASGDNVLTMVLTEHTPHSVLDYMSWYAHTSLLGIWREACLFHVPKLHLGATDLMPDWDVVDGSGSIAFATDIVNLGSASQSYSMEISVSDEGQLLHRTTLAGEVGATASVRRNAAIKVADVGPWSAEVPRRYDLEIALKSADGRVASYRRRVGFRRVKVSGNQLLVNGAPIRLIGVNRHDARMRTGRSMRYEDLRHDVLALREANVNIIRTAHYPADPRLLELCDELGMYVQDQMPICFAAGFDDHHWTRTNDAAHLVPIVLEVTAETVGRDQPHPSVIIWDLANETQWAWGFDVQLALVRQMDPSRPTIFSFDLNQIGDVNPLPHMRPQDRPDIRTYHYPGWDRSWQEDIDWLRTYDQPVVLDECSPPFQDNARAPLHAEILAIDPGFRDYWVTGARPFMDRAMRDTGCIGGMIWSAVDDQWTLPIDESVGFGNWAHLTKLDYYRVRDVHPPQDGRYFRGEGEWGLLDGWGRTRPELWHVHKMFSPIEIVGATFDAGSTRLELTIRNRHSHRSLETLELRIKGAVVSDGARVEAAPGAVCHLALTVLADASLVEIAFRHPEGWTVDAFSWDVPGRGADPQSSPRAGAEPLQLSLEKTGSVKISGMSPWLTGWPRFHLQAGDGPQVSLPLPAIDRSRAAVAADGAITVPLEGGAWDGAMTVRVTGKEATFDYACTYSGDGRFNVREVGLAFDLPADLTDLWWDRKADWSAYPAGHIGRARGYAQSAAGPANPLSPASRWEDDTTPAGTNDYRSTKRSVLAAGVTDGRSSVTVLSDGSQHVRASIVDGAPVLHVLDWYGGVPFRMDTDHIWTSNFGTGQKVERGTTLRGRIILVSGKLPAEARTAGRAIEQAEGQRA